MSLVPSVTETLLAWGIVPVACTRFCEQPALPHVGGTKDPDTDAIAALRPEAVVMDEEENRLEDYRALRAIGVRVEALAVRSLGDVTGALVRLAALARVDPPPPGSPATAARTGSRRAAFVPIWRWPWMALGQPTYGASVLEALGIRTVGGAGPYDTVELGEVAALSPDLVVAPSEPYPFSGRQLPELRAVGPTVLVDGKDLFWWGARTPGALRRLADVMAAVT